MISLYSHCLVITVTLTSVLQVADNNQCTEGPCSCCKTGTCEDPAIYKYPCRGCINGRTGPSCHEPCPETCFNCSQLYFEYESEEICYQCKNGYYSGRYKDVPDYPLLQDCSLFCNIGCEYCTSFLNCSYCKSGYFMDSTKECRKCPENCVRCTSDKICSQCADGFVWDEKNCRQCMPSCKRCKINEECVECFSEFYMSGLGGCKRCQSGCLSCKDDTSCSECKTGYYINNNKCFSCRSNCISCDFKFFYTCNKCGKGYYKSNEECYKCPEGCASCETASSCQTCDRNYKLHNGLCYVCPLSCTECSSDNFCVSCTKSYYYKNGKCAECPKNCTACANSSECLSCIDGYHGTLCSLQCRQNCKDNVCNITTGICVTCSNGNFKDNHHNCKKCSEHCTVCDSSSSCLDCKAGYMGLNCEQTCQNCQPGTKCDKSSGYCLDECKDGFSGKGCDQRCNTECFSCDRNNPSKCQVCASNRYGVACWQVCPSTCLINTCNDYDGICTYGCNPGFWGPRCEHTCAYNCSENLCFRNNGTCSHLCSKGFYGKGCQNTCSAGCVDKLCNDTTGECLSGCLEGFNGKLCEKGSSDAPMIVGITVTTVVIVAVIVFILLWIRRKQTREKKGYTRCAQEESSYTKRELEGKQAENVIKDSPVPPPRTQNEKRKSLAHDLEDTKPPKSSANLNLGDNAPGILQVMPSLENLKKFPPEQTSTKATQNTIPLVIYQREKHTSETNQPNRETSATEQFNQDGLEREQPKPEASLIEQPKQEVSVTQQPTQEASVTQQTKQEGPVTKQNTEEAAVTQQPKQEAAATQQPKQECPVAQKHMHDAAVAQQPTQKASVTQQPELEISAAQQSTQEASVTQQPKQEASVTQQPKPESPVTQQPTQEASLTLQSEQDEMVTQHPHQEVLITQQPKQQTSLTVSPLQNTLVNVKTAQGTSVTIQIDQETSVIIHPDQETLTELHHGEVISSTVPAETEKPLTTNRSYNRTLDMSEQSTKDNSLGDSARSEKKDTTLTGNKQENEKSSQDIEHTSKSENDVQNANKKDTTLTANEQEHEKYSQDVNEPNKSQNVVQDKNKGGTLMIAADDVLFNTYSASRTSSGYESADDIVGKVKETTEPNQSTEVLNCATSDQLREQLKSREITEEFRQLQAIRVEENAALYRVKDAPCIMNARYISGYHKEREYIIALEPPMNHAKDPLLIAQFWKMIWQEDCGKIVMLNNQTEDMMSSRHQYWPHVSKEDIHGDIKVECWKEEKFYLPYIYRGLIIKFIKLTDEKDVVHIEYFKWPDEGIPRDLSDLVDFSRAFDSYHTEGPIFVHCRNDIGNIGIIIAIHILHKQAANEKGHIDIYGCVRRLREQCPAMFQTEEQYRALYKAFDKTKNTGTDHPSSSDEDSESMTRGTSNEFQVYRS